MEGLGSLPDEESLLTGKGPGEVKRAKVIKVDVQRGLTVTVDGCDKCLIPFTELRDRYLPLPDKPHRAGDVVKCWFVEEVGLNLITGDKTDLQRWKIYSMRKSRQKKSAVKDPVISELSQLKVGQLYRGFITHAEQLKKGSRITVMLSHRVRGTVIKLKKLLPWHRSGNVITVQVVSYVEKAGLLYLRHVDDRQISQAYSKSKEKAAGTEPVVEIEAASRPWQDEKQERLVIAKLKRVEEWGDRVLKVPGVGGLCILPPTEVGDRYRDSYVLTDERCRLGSKIRCWLIDTIQTEDGRPCRIYSCRNTRLGKKKQATDDRCVDDVGCVLAGDRVNGFITHIHPHQLTVSLSYKVRGHVAVDQPVSKNWRGKLVSCKVTSVDKEKEEIKLELVHSDLVHPQTTRATIEVVSSEAGDQKPTDLSADSGLSLDDEDEEFDLSDSWSGFRPKRTAPDPLPSCSAPPTKKSKRQKKQEEEERERLTARTEQELLDPERPPQSADDFDRLVAQSPDSSLIWLRYLAHHLEAAEIDKARAVAERALKTINFREDQERYNVWAAYITLELSYGSADDEALEKLVARAVGNCDDVKILTHYSQQLEQHGKIQECEEVHRRLTRRHGAHRLELWLNQCGFLYRQQRHTDARALVARALKTLDKRHHVELLFGHARLEWTSGDVERSRTMFENVLSTCPRRLDLWNQYIDLNVKQNDIKAARRILERAVSMDISAKRLKSMLKKWLDLEKKHGDALSVQNVLDKARQIAEAAD